MLICYLWTLLSKICLLGQALAYWVNYLLNNKYSTNSIFLLIQNCRKWSIKSLKPIFIGITQSHLFIQKNAQFFWMNRRLSWAEYYAPTFLALSGSFRRVYFPIKNRPKGYKSRIKVVALLKKISNLPMIMSKILCTKISYPIWQF